MLIFTIVNLLIQKKQYKGKEASVGLNKSYLWMLLIFYILPKLMMNLMLVGVCFAATFANIIPKKRVDKIVAVALEDTPDKVPSKFFIIGFLG